MTDISSRSFSIAAQTVRWLTSAFLFAAGVLFVISLGALILDIILRYGFNSSIIGLHEIVTITFLYVFLFGASALYARNEDIVIEVLWRRFPERTRQWLTLIVYGVVASTMAVVLVETIVLIITQLQVPTPQLRLPLAIMWIPLGFAAISITFGSLVEAWGCIVWIRSGTRLAVWPRPGPEDSHKPLEEVHYET
jgi:TRAP-type C4-dicarboxylate transport system permease small subunit